MDASQAKTMAYGNGRMAIVNVTIGQVEVSSHWENSSGEYVYTAIVYQDRGVWTVMSMITAIIGEADNTPIIRTADTQGRALAIAMRQAMHSETRVLQD